MDKEICSICKKGIHYAVTRNEYRFLIEAGDAFADGLTNPLKTVDSTVGGMNRKHLHDLLDEWIDHIIKGNDA